MFSDFKVLFDKQDIFLKDRFRDFMLTLFYINVQPVVVSVVYINDFSDDGREL